ncbi:MAG TPA: hypothetical protein VGO09_05875 [Flavisolibacter sp.]|nr:hypothetical protein [Flavisolibacter sp.]
MSIKTHILAQELLAKNSIEECNLHEIKELVYNFPYYAPAQFLLLEKLKETNDPGYIEQLHKAVLYYHDPLVFEYFISSDKFYSELAPEPEIELLPEGQMETITNEPEVENAVSNTPDITEQASTEEPLAFEPFHTVDYFASQGIKLAQDEIPKDKLGKQLKSFTEWLKTMKRLPEKQIIQNIDTVSEKNVQHLAEDSIHDPSVVTESMAEVWLKQGNIPKAIEVYNKLKLLNPSKMAYFAAKIENLKT